MGRGQPGRDPRRRWPGAGDLQRIPRRDLQAHGAGPGAGTVTAGVPGGGRGRHRLLDPRSREPRHKLVGPDVCDLWPRAAGYARPQRRDGPGARGRYSRFAGALAGSAQGRGVDGVAHPDRTAGRRTQIPGRKRCLRVRAGRPGGRSARDGARRHGKIQGGAGPCRQRGALSADRRERHRHDLAVRPGGRHQLRESLIAFRPGLCVGGAARAAGHGFRAPGRSPHTDGPVREGIVGRSVGFVPARPVPGDPEGRPVHLAGGTAAPDV